MLDTASFILSSVFDVLSPVRLSFVKVKAPMTNHIIYVVMLKLVIAVVVGLCLRFCGVMHFSLCRVMNVRINMT